MTFDPQTLSRAYVARQTDTTWRPRDPIAKPTISERFGEFAYHPMSKLTFAFMAGLGGLMAVCIALGAVGS